MRPQALVKTLLLRSANGATPPPPPPPPPPKQTNPPPHPSCRLDLCDYPAALDQHQVPGAQHRGVRRVCEVNAGKLTTARGRSTRFFTPSSSSRCTVLTARGHLQCGGDVVTALIRNECVSSQPTSSELDKCTSRTAAPCHVATSARRRCADVRDRGGEGLQIPLHGWYALSRTRARPRPVIGLDRLRRFA